MKNNLGGSEGLAYPPARPGGFNIFKGIPAWGHGDIRRGVTPLML